LPEEVLGPADAGASIEGEKPVWFESGFLPTRVYMRDRLRPGNQLTGPAVIFQYDTTTVIPPDWRLIVDRRANIIATRR